MPLPSRRLVFVASALALLAAALGALAAACGSADRAPPGGKREQTELRPVVSATIPVGEAGDGIEAVAAGAGEVWVAGGGECPAPVWRIDPETNTVAATSAVDNASRLAVREGAVWALGGVCAPTPAQPGGVSGGAALFRIDPRDGELAATIPLEPNTGPFSDAHGSGLAVGEGGLWAATCLDPRSGEVVRVDPETNRVVARISTGGCTGELAAGAGAVWVLSHPEWTDETKILSASLHRIDPATNRLVATPLQGELAFLGGTFLGPLLTAGDGAVWVRGVEEVYPHRNVALRVDARTNELTRKPLSGGFAPFAVTDEDVWFLGSRGPHAALSRLDGRTLRIAESLALERGSADAVFDRERGSFWIADFEPVREGQQAVVRVDLR
jgi:hypothetical protein